ncbi:bifunctional GNAT family N-acetyltransferase/class I SAM-dependent methyltransferase [Massilia sp. R2A-15]|uniref:bifunctional GNAT family N-acetyltransferase/class I SAM-dependent methyltransferase n=1 Tax=Massilia sp. R2A-15 TaxID=3064278 RepID=UPI0027324501|nr:bifunctional GNAT family N-acetyltransferase/class I SAM-dependent methyltransferase [Massilia sp. R2A-15]WLI90081.1 bifunctional GNAT family N-acetyltransferase/class I SAM-dependent methyltransferase [Massilia sp. R2A-15]
MQVEKIIWVRAGEITEKILGDCAALFCAYYGKWGPEASKDKAGKPVMQQASKLKSQYLAAPDSWSALAYLDDVLIGYAFFQRLLIEKKGYVTWVTQFVVHKEHQNRGLGTRILRSIWSQSQQYAWGLVTANPAAVRALEKATLRRCNLAHINADWQLLRAAAAPNLGYIRTASVELRDGTSSLNTHFALDHSDSDASLKTLSEKAYKWQLGDLRATEEWAAFTFDHQPYSDDAVSLVEEWVADCDRTVADAYESMTLDTSHKWQAYTPSEIDFLIRSIQPREDAKILDLGCGAGRHSIELARRGYICYGVDASTKLILNAKANVSSEDLSDKAGFVAADAREWRSAVRFDHAICLYDVIGSFAADAENAKLLATAFFHLKPGGKFLASVMNGELTDYLATNRANRSDLANKLLDLPPSNIMQTTGAIFDPSFFVWHEEVGVAYRREQFESEKVAPCELVVRDRRYSAESVRRLFAQIGFEILDVQYAKLGAWGQKASFNDKGAKEILILCQKPLHP